jgi:hypothetical protein
VLYDVSTLHSTMLPVINAFKAAHHLCDVAVVADAGMISEANHVALARRTPRRGCSRSAGADPAVAGQQW